jgi:hypothetical protein
MTRFEYTTEGYLEAKKWLQDIGEWDRVSNQGFSNQGFSTDGWSITQTANIIWDKQFPGTNGKSFNIKLNEDYFIGNKNGNQNK